MKANFKVVVASLALFLCLLLADSAGATNFTLTVTAVGSGTISTNPTFASYPSNVVVTLTGTPNTGWYFANWSGDLNSTANPLNVTMDSNVVVTGTFLAYPTYTLALATNGQGGIVLSPPGGSYYSNTMVTATATAAAGWVFAEWNGAVNSSANPVTFALNSSGTLTGAFAQLPAIDVQPVSVTNKAGSTVNFTSHAVGTAPVNYEWYFSGGAITTVANNAALSLTNVGTGQAGNYWVVATNNYGSATSQVASLTVTNAAGPTNLVNSANQASLLAAIAFGGWVGIDINGTLTLTSTIVITNNVVLDGTGFGAVISGGDAVQLFYVTNGASLTLSNLTLANGNCLVTTGSPGTPADGGAICNNGGVVAVVGCTLTNNAAQALISGGVAQGGAIFNNAGTVSMSQSVLISNSVTGGAYTGTYNSGTTGEGFGGVLYNTNGMLVISGCAVIGNLSQSVCDEGGYGLTMGGAIFQASGTLNITNSSFTWNRAVGGIGGEQEFYVYPGSPAYGGAAAVTGGGLTIELGQFSNNQAEGAQGEAGSEGGGAGPASGGAVYFTGAGSASDSTFSGNQAMAGNYPSSVFGPPVCGGGIYNEGLLTLNRCSVCNNNAQGGAVERDNAEFGGGGFGGGIFNGDMLLATNCTIALNSVIGAFAYSDPGLSPVGTNGSAIGGGVYNNAGASCVAMNLTIASNSCSSPPFSYGFPYYELSIGLAAGSQIANTNGTLSVHNTLIAYGTNSNAYGPITDDGYNICSDGSASLDNASYNYTDPQLAPLGNYGGPTLCMALLPTSPAIDNADPSDFPPTDQRGYLRPFGSGPDMGAYEYGSAAWGVPYVGIGMSGTNVTLSFSAFVTNTYYLQYSTNLATWINLSTNGPFSVPTYVNQTVSQEGMKHCFFRLLRVP